MLWDGCLSFISTSTTEEKFEARFRQHLLSSSVTYLLILFIHAIVGIEVCKETRVYNDTTS